MLKEAELDRFLDEFFDGTMPVQSEEKNTDESTEDLEEYTLPTDGLIIRQMKRDGKVSRRTWAALALMVIIVPADPLSFSKNFSRKKIYGVQPDRCCGGYASVFYDV